MGILEGAGAGALGGAALGGPLLALPGALVGGIAGALGGGGSTHHDRPVGDNEIVVPRGTNQADYPEGYEYTGYRDENNDYILAKTDAQQASETLADAAQASQIDYDEIVSAALRIAEGNLARFPRIADTATESALKSGASLDEYMSNRFYSNLEGVLPTYKEDIIGTSRQVLQDVKGVSDEFLSGEIPQDVQDEILRSRAELGISKGLFGEARDYATARDLGLTSLDLVTRGVDLAVNAVSPLTQRLLTQAQQLTPPVTDVAAMTSNFAQLAAGGSTLAPNAALQAGTQIGVANAQTIWNSALSSVNTALDFYQTDMQAQMNSDALSSARTNSLIGAGAQIAGALIPSFF